MPVFQNRKQFWDAIDQQYTVPHSYVTPEQHGPLRQFDREMRCASKGCGAPTYFKLQGRPKCIIHALRNMNEMLVEAGIEK